MRRNRWTVRLRISCWSRQRGRSAHRRARRIQAPSLRTQWSPSEVLPAVCEPSPRRYRAPARAAAPNRARRGESQEFARSLQARWWHGCRPNRFRWPVLSYQGVILKKSYPNKSLLPIKQRNIIRFWRIMITKMFFLFAFERLFPLAYCHCESCPCLRELGRRRLAGPWAPAIGKETRSTDWNLSRPSSLAATRSRNNSVPSLVVGAGPIRHGGRLVLGAHGNPTRPCRERVFHDARTLACDPQPRRVLWHGRGQRQTSPHGSRASYLV